MYLPKSKYSEPKYTRGNDFVVEATNGDYVGWYFSTYKNEYYTGKVPSKTSSKLVELDGGDQAPVQEKFVSNIIVPSSNDYAQGFFTRYFIQDKRNQAVIEVTKERYTTLKNLPHISTETVIWNLTTPVENINKGPYIYFGSESKNKDAVVEAEKTIKNLNQYIKSYSEFVK